MLANQPRVNHRTIFVNFPQQKRKKLTCGFDTERVSLTSKFNDELLWPGSLMKHLEPHAIDKFVLVKSQRLKTNIQHPTAM
jgi:hypothetical protein